MLPILGEFMKAITALEVIVKIITFLGILRNTPILKKIITLLKILRNMLIKKKLKKR